MTVEYEATARRKAWQDAFDALPDNADDPRWVQHFCCRCSTPITDKRFQTSEVGARILCRPCGDIAAAEHKRWVHFRAT